MDFLLLLNKIKQKTMKQDDPKEPAEVEQPVTTNEGEGEGDNGAGGDGPGSTNPPGNPPPTKP